MVAVILGLNRTAEACKKNSMFFINNTGLIRWQMGFPGQIVTNVNFMMHFTNGGIKSVP